MSKPCLVLLVTLSTICCLPNKVLATDNPSIIPILSLLLSSTSHCAEANGLHWCRHPYDLGGANCNDVCAGNGMVPVANNTVWLEAQDSIVECEAIRDAVGLTGTIEVGSYKYACAEYLITSDKFYCSTYSECPNEHRTGTDDAAYWFSICPCEKSS